MRCAPLINEYMETLRECLFHVIEFLGIGRNMFSEVAKIEGRRWKSK